MLPRLFAWSAHLFTGMGLICAAGIGALITFGDPYSFRTAFSLMLVATVIDAIDGTIARAAHVSTVLPEFDGRRLDDIIDFQTYTSLPLLLMWRAHLVEGAWLLFPLLASAYGFCRKEAKTPDGYFLGFPSYWNIVAFYCYFLNPPAPVTMVLVTLLAFLTFVPSRYLYPSQGGRLNILTVLLAAPWTVMLIAVCAGFRSWALPSLYFPVFYLAASWWVTLRTKPYSVRA